MLRRSQSFEAAMRMLPENRQQRIRGRVPESESLSADDLKSRLRDLGRCVELPDDRAALRVDGFSPALRLWLLSRAPAK